MSRPIKQRRICELPRWADFGPEAGASAETVEMTIDEYEAIRLIDHLGLSQEECARQMEVARSTAQAIYLSARDKLALMMVEGRKLHIAGGAYSVCPQAVECSGKECRCAQCHPADQCTGSRTPDCEGCCRDEKSNVD